MSARQAGAMMALLAAASMAAGTGCEPPAARPPAAQGEKRPQPVATATPARTDALGSKPELARPQAFTPPAPAVLEAPNGMKVWLLERHALPLVSVTIVVPSGSADDPKGAAGLAFATADMLDEGAGRRNAVELSSAINDLGATLEVVARTDGSLATVSVLRKNFAPAFSILADVVARPRFDPKEWKRVSELWQNSLKKRSDDPAQVSRVVSLAALHGPGTPYGHPSEGLLADAQSIGLPAVKAFYKSAWRPDRAVLVVAGDITRDEVMQAISRELGAWTAPTKAGKTAGAKAAPGAPAATPAPAWKPPRLVLVDRPGAPQAAISVAREGLAASDPRLALLELVNSALGGSFTSRLNQNLREDHGWTYGAASSFSETRQPGNFRARAAVVTEATGPALKEMLGELAKMADSGLTQDEFAKVLSQDRADLVQSYETVSRTSQRLGALALLGLPPTFDADASLARQKTTLPGLAELARAVDPKGATVVVVGPRQEVLPQLQSIGLGEPELWDAEGQPVQPKRAP
jgi:zinc protease